MAEYRAYFMSPDGKIIGGRAFILENDRDAITLAEHLVGTAPIELWCGNRMVHRFAPREKT
ncbi:hypothetical protein [Bradyrhizobium sp. C9]|uniref:hypothetical protein n=1 Tax=Bradyrhizobium sp. C9 TaxID=142585 RepID=UPI000BE8EED4|nr:hypothetical protein [Bradyrhizobium sp. C9]PDT75092.1 hypothetical protein CO675_22710 [Bradyrhizobium sp. C9]